MGAPSLRRSPTVPPLFCTVGDLRKEGAPDRATALLGANRTRCRCAVRMRSDLLAPPRGRRTVSLRRGRCRSRRSRPAHLRPAVAGRRLGAFASRSAVRHRYGDGRYPCLGVCPTRSRDRFAQRVRSGIEIWPRLHDLGYDATPSQAGIQISFPIQRMAESILAVTMSTAKFNVSSLTRPGLANLRCDLYRELSRSS